MAISAITLCSNKKRSIVARKVCNVAATIAPQMKRQVAVLNLTKRLPICDCHLCKNCASLKDSLVFAQFVSEDSFQSTKLLQMLVDMLMAGSNIFFQLCNGWRVKIIGFPNGFWLTTISKISLCFFVCLQQFLLQSSSKDDNVRESTTRKGSIDPHNVTGCNAQTYFIPVS